MATVSLRTLSDREALRPQYQQGTFFVQTWGCQMNVEDSEQIALYLQDLGLRAVTDVRSAQVVLLNTCSVRKKPEDKAFSMLGYLGKLVEEQPDRVIGVCGCMAQVRADEIKQRHPYVNFVLGTGDLSSVGSLVEEALQGKRFQKRLALPERRGAVVEDLPQRHSGRSAALKSFVPIQYGCDKFCTFCIVPSTRGRERSRPVDHIVEEIRQLVARGTREVTLLGQTVNSYGKNLASGKTTFAELLWKLAEIDGLQRIRYTSPYPRDFRSDLIDTIRDCEPVMEHLHMPLQAGNNDVLRAMRRLYTVESFRAIVDEVRAKIPHCGLTTDVIVGFPGETEAQFEDTLRVMAEIEFDHAYMFKYSIRPGTKAGEMEQVPEKVKEERLERLIAQQNEIALRKHQACVGHTFEVLIDAVSEKDRRILKGYTREWKQMHFPGNPNRIGRIAQVRATQAKTWGLMGELVNGEDA